MLRHAWIGLILVSSVAFGAVHPTPRWYSGIQTVAFQNGVSPDASYAGNVLTYIDESSATTNYSAIDSVRIGTPSTGTDRMRILWQVDLSAIPDSAVIVDAILELFRSSHSSTYTSTVDDNLGFYRCFYNWTESQATWNKRKSSPSDTTWSTAGLQDIAGQLPSGAYGLISAMAIRSGWDVGTTNTERGLINDTYALAVGTDSVYSGYGLSAAMDRNNLPDVIGNMKPVPAASPANRAITHYDVSRLVRNWHAKMWGNKGAMLRILGDESSTTNAGHYVAYRSDNDATAAYRPRLIVRYVLVTPDASSGQGGGGRLTIGG